MIFLCISKCANHKAVITLESNHGSIMLRGDVEATHFACVTSEWIPLKAETLGDIEEAIDAEHQRLLETA